jgi:hypothetical protein
MEDPSGRYGRFVENLEAARNRAKIKFVNFLANNPDWKARWKLMKNYWPQEFSERIVQQISGPDGGPIQTETKQPYQLIISMTKTDREVLERETGLPVREDGTIEFPMVDKDGEPLTERDRELCEKLHAGPLFNHARS